MRFTALEKKIIIIGVFAIMISTTIVYLFQNSFATWLGISELSSQSSEENVKKSLLNSEKSLKENFGVTPIPEGPVTVSVKMEGQGVAGIWLNLKSPHKISGIELIFSVGKTLQINKVECEVNFVCITNDLVNGKLVLAGYRPMNKMDIYFKKSVKIGTFKYNSNTTGEIVLNYNTSKPSIITQTGSGLNLLSKRLHIYSLDKPQ